MKKRIIAIVAIITLVAVLGVILCACNASSYQKKLEKNGYNVSVVDKNSKYFDDYNAVMKKEGYEGGLVWMVEGVKANLSLKDGFDGGEVSIIKFKKLADAKKYVKDMGGEDDNLVRKGSIVIEGDKDSVKLVK